MAGYSSTSLIKKLGIKNKQEVAFINPPKGYVKSLHVPQNVSIGVSNNLEILQFFTSKKTVLEKEFPKLINQISKNGALWISWPKRSSGVKTDLDENIVRQIGLNNGLVDIKIIAVGEIWSGLKFVYRLMDRKV